MESQGSNPELVPIGIKVRASDVCYECMLGPIARRPPEVIYGPAPRRRRRQGPSPGVSRLPKGIKRGAGRKKADETIVHTESTEPFPLFEQEACRTTAGSVTLAASEKDNGNKESATERVHHSDEEGKDQDGQHGAGKKAGFHCLYKDQSIKSLASLVASEQPTRPISPAGPSSSRLANEPKMEDEVANGSLEGKLSSSRKNRSSSEPFTKREKHVIFGDQASTVQKFDKDAPATDLFKQHRSCSSSHHPLRDQDPFPSRDQSPDPRHSTDNSLSQDRSSSRTRYEPSRNRSSSRRDSSTRHGHASSSAGHRERSHSRHTRSDDASTFFSAAEHLDEIGSSQLSQQMQGAEYNTLDNSPGRTQRRRKSSNASSRHSSCRISNMPGSWISESESEGEGRMARHGRDNSHRLSVIDEERSLSRRGSQSRSDIRYSQANESIHHWEELNNKEEPTITSPHSDEEWIPNPSVISPDDSISQVSGPRSHLFESRRRTKRMPGAWSSSDSSHAPLSYRHPRQLDIQDSKPAPHTSAEQSSKSAHRSHSCPSANRHRERSRSNADRS